MERKNNLNDSILLVPFLESYLVNKDFSNNKGTPDMKCSDGACDQVSISQDFEQMIEKYAHMTEGTCSDQGYTVDEDTNER